MAYRYDPGIIKVQKGAHYRVQTYVQTTPMKNARARLTAYFVDGDQKPLADSVAHSELYASNGDTNDWRQLSD